LHYSQQYHGAACGHKQTDTKEAILNQHIHSLVMTGIIVISSDASMAETSDSPYMGIQYAIGDIGVAETSETFNPTTLVARVGKYFRNHYAIEGRMAIPLSDDTKTISGTNTTVGLFSLLGVYGTAHLNLWKRNSVYGIAGLSLVKGKVESSNTNVSDSDIGISYGIGADIGIGKTVLNIEYISYSDETNFDLNALGLGLKIIF
jgi:hypothetical protein